MSYLTLPPNQPSQATILQHVIAYWRILKGLVSSVSTLETSVAELQSAATPTASAATESGKVKLTISDTAGYLQDKVGQSIVVDAALKKITLEGDEETPTSGYSYGVNIAGVQGFEKSYIEGNKILQHNLLGGL